MLRWLAPHFYLVMFAANIVLLGQPIFRAILVAQAAGALCALAAYLGEQRIAVPRCLRPVVYFYLMNYALGRGFLRFVLGTQKVTWDHGPIVSMKTDDDGLTQSTTIGERGV